MTRSTPGIRDAGPVEPDLDSWLPDPQLRTRHRRSAKADPETLWHAAESVRVDEVPALGRIVRWRIPKTPADSAFRDIFRRYPFTVLDEGDLWSVSGLCGRIWTIHRDYPRLSGPDEFLGWDERGTVRVLFAHWVEGGDRTSTLVSETRVQPVDRRAGLRTRALWTAVGQFERLIGREALRVAARRAEKG
jgi:hypothetical protein